MAIQAMTVAYLTSVTLCLLTQGSSGLLMDQGSSSCQNYTAAMIDSSQCSTHLRAQEGLHHGNFKDLLIEMTDAAQQEHNPGFLLYVTTYMYQFLHCASDVQAVADLIYQVPLDHLPPSNSVWWNKAYDILHPPNVGNPIGRRRKRSAAPADSILLYHQIVDIAHNMHPGCVQWLIEQFLPTSRRYFLSKHPHFPNPNDYTVKPTTPTFTTAPTTTTTTKTTATTVTTHKSTPTTATTPATVTTIPPLTTSTTPVTTRGHHGVTSTSAHSLKPTNTGGLTATPVKCAECSDLKCLTDTMAQMTQQCPEGLCMVHMKESSERGRIIERSCGTKDKCTQAKMNNSLQCEDVELKEITWNTDCTFCCDEDDCNKPPSIIPLSGRWPPTRTDGR